MVQIYSWILLFCLFLWACISPAPGQTIFKINQYNITYDGTFMPVFTLFANQQLNEKIGFASYFYVNGTKNSSWGEGLAGPMWTPVRPLTLGFLGGFQSNEEKLWRVSPIILYNSRKISGFGAFEYGGKRHRWDLMCFYSAPPFRYGAELIRFYKMFAAGPRVEFSFLKTQPITIFYSGLWNWKDEKYASMFGIFTTFGPKR